MVVTAGQISNLCTVDNHYCCHCCPTWLALYQLKINVQLIYVNCGQQGIDAEAHRVNVHDLMQSVIFGL